MMRGVPFLLAGALFAVGLAVSGMTNPARVLGFLDVAGTWDPSLAFVMGGALLAFAVGHRIVLRRERPLLGGSFPSAPEARIDARLLSGAALFGIGWGLAGFCPGPAVVSLGWPREPALWFVPAMVVGMLLAQRLFGVDVAEA